ncbi:MAG TPA: serine/threonine protein kinase [Sorangium sp.]|nr:serine/threonine protein kinase [Sorangium sp.]
MGAPAHDSLEGNSKYRIISELGRGGMGEVFLGEHTALGAKVVIKLLHAELSSREGLVDRMRLEAQALARLSHPNIVRVTDFDSTPSGRPYFVMEYLPGKTLSDYVKARGGFVPVPEAIDITCQALSGLAAAHEAGMVHRDMKLDNLFVCDRSMRASYSGITPPRTVKILDFGIAKVVRGAGDDAPAPLMVPTTTGMVVGTPRFFAPEQARGQQLDGRADIYAMGLVLYSLVAGRGPFDDATSVSEMAKAHVIRKPQPPSHFARQAIPAALDRAVLRAIAKRPADRYQSALSFEQALRAIDKELDDTAPQPAHPAAAPDIAPTATAARWPSLVAASTAPAPPAAAQRTAPPNRGSTQYQSPTHVDNVGTAAVTAPATNSGAASYPTTAPLPHTTGNRSNGSQPTAVGPTQAMPAVSPTAAAHTPRPQTAPAPVNRVATGLALLIVLLSGLIGAAAAALYLRFTS